MNTSSDFAAPSCMLRGDDKPDCWGTDAKLKVKVGVVSVTMEQHTEGRLKDSQPMVDLEMVVSNVVVSTITCRRLGECLHEGLMAIVFRQD